MKKNKQARRRTSNLEVGLADRETETKRGKKTKTEKQRHRERERGGGEKRKRGREHVNRMYLPIWSK